MFLSLAMLVSLAACGGGGAEQSAAPSEQSPAGASAAVESSDAQASQGVSAENLTSVQRDVINVGIEADCTNFNPWSFSGTGANLAIFSLYQPLLQPAGGEYYPSILKSYEMADDGLSMSGEMFDYIYDWAGNHITADDVLFSWEKACEAYPQNASLVKEVVKTGDYSVEFQFARDLYVGELETVAKLFVVSKTAFEDSADEMNATPVGTGPYKLTQYTSGYMFTYEKVEDWWQTDEAQIHPRDMANVNTINWYVITESSQRTIALEQGTIDMCSSIASQDLEKFDQANNHWLYSVPDNLSMTLFPNCDESSPCSDLNLRLAICYAISNQAVLDSVYNGNGAAMHEQAPAWSVGYNETWEKEDNYYSYDAGKAAEYLAQSDYNGETLTIICTTDESSVNTAQMVQNFLLQIGIDSKVESYESTVFNQYIQSADMWDIMLNSRPTNVYYVNAVYSTLSAGRYEWGGSMNFVYDDQLQELIDLCYYEATHTEENLELLHQHLIDNCYVMGLVNRTVYSVIPDGVSDVTLSWRKSIIPGGCIYN